MALKIGDLFAVLRLETGGYEKSIEDAQNAAKKLKDELQNLSGTLTTRVTLPIVALGGAALKMAGDMEQAQVAFTTLLGSASEAEKFVKDLQGFAAETPFEMKGLQDSARKLLAFGFQSKQVLPMMTAIGNAVSALGGGAVEIESVTRAIGQMQAKGKVSAEEMNQLAEVGINGWDLLASKMGQTQAEIMAQAQAGTLAAGPAIEAMLSELNARFSGAMEDQSKTFLGRLSTLKDNASFALAEFGKALMPVANSIMTVFSGLTWLLGAFGKLPGPIQVAGLALLVMAAAAGPMLRLVLMIDAARKSIIVASLAARIGAISFRGMWTAALGPVGLVIGALGLVAGGITLLWRRCEPFREAVTRMWTAIKLAAVRAWTAIKAIVMPVWAALKRAFVELWKAIRPALAALWESLKPVLQAFWDILKPVLKLIALVAGSALLGPLLIAMGVLWGLAKTLTFFANVWLKVFRDIARVTKSVFGPIVAWLEDKIQTVGGFFKWLYDKVVGHSWIPDMVTGIGRHIARLGKEMVQPVLSATRRVGVAFRNLAQGESLVTGTMRQAVDGGRSLVERPVLKLPVGGSLVAGALRQADPLLNMILSQVSRFNASKAIENPAVFSGLAPAGAVVKTVQDVVQQVASTVMQATRTLRPGRPEVMGGGGFAYQWSPDVVRDYLQRLVMVQEQLLELQRRQARPLYEY